MCPALLRPDPWKNTAGRKEFGSIISRLRGNATTKEKKEKEEVEE